MRLSTCALTVALAAISVPAAAEVPKPAALTADGVPAVPDQLAAASLTGENEGHGFAKKENIDYLFWTTMMFWQNTLLKP